MNRLTCEMCNSNDIIKQDGYYICQSCGTKYTVEEARKMMIEGTVDVSGSTVKVDNSSFIRNALENARRAKSKQDWEECERYYDIVEQYDPKNIEAIFYSSYGKAQMSMIDPDRFKREQKVNVLKNSISVIDDNYDNSPEKFLENKQMIEQIDTDLFALINGSFVYNKTTRDGVTTDDSSYTYTMFIQLCLGWIESLQNIVKVIPTEQNRLYLWKLVRKSYVYIYMHIKADRTDFYKDKIRHTDQIIKCIDPNYQPETVPWRESCYVATCVYGSYDCPQVWTLRRYRDYTLASTWYGRAFIRTYYAISPTIVKRFGDTKWFKNMWKPKLDKMVDKLMAKGVENTPYKDKNW